MKKKIIICLIILNFIFTITTYSKDKKLILDDITIAIDSGHGGKDIGTSYNNILLKKYRNMNFGSQYKISLQ